MADWSLLRSCRALAGRLSFRSLYNGRVASPGDWVHAVLAVRKRWRWFLGQLHEARWPPARRSKLHAKFLAHCPPFGLVLPEGARAPKARACLRPLFCPFCHAREYAVNAYDRLVPLLPAVAGEMILCGTEREYVIRPADYATPTAAYLAAKAVVAGPDRRAEVDAVKPVGAVVFHRVRLSVFFNPVVNRDEVTRLTVVRTALMLARRSRRVVAPPGAELSVIPDPKRYDLAVEVGRLFRYPYDWYEAPAGVPAALARHLAKARVFAAYGKCRRAGGVAAEVSAAEDDVDTTDTEYAET